MFREAPIQTGNDSGQGRCYDDHMCCKFCDNGCIIAHGESENEHCFVEVITAQVPEHDIEGWLKIQIRAHISGREYCCNDSVPDRARIKFLTTDDYGKKISLWVYYNDKFFQKVLCVENGGLIPYKIDYRHNEGWGHPQVIVESGDARRMMLISGAHCRVWYSRTPTAGDGRNVCDFLLSDYGLIPPESVLPNFRLERGFEYKIDQRTAYRLMNELCGIFATRELRCIIRMPENSESDIERTNQGLLHLERAQKALLDGNEILSVIELSKSIGIGVMPDDALLDKRHKIVKRYASCHLIKVWQQAYRNKYWEGKALRLFSADGASPDVATYGIHVRLDAGEDVSPVITIVKCKNFNNGDILGLHYVAEEYGTRLIELCRYATESNPNVLKKKWGIPLPESQYVTAMMERMRISDCACSIVVDKDVYVIDLGSGTILKHLKNLKFIQDSKIDFDSMSPLRFCVVNESQFMAFDRDFNLIDGLSDWASGILGKQRIFDVSNDGTKILFDVGWGIEICDLIRRKVDVVMRYNPYPCFCHAIFSPCGGAIALSRGTHLRIFDLKSKKTVFEYAVHDAEPIREMCFDKTGRFVYALYGHNKIETFQLYWDIEENGNEAR